MTQFYYVFIEIDGVSLFEPFVTRGSRTLLKRMALSATDALIAFLSCLQALMFLEPQLSSKSSVVSGLTAVLVFLLVLKTRYDR